MRAGDTIYAESEILGKRESQSRPAQAVLHVSTRAVNQRGEEVCAFERRLLIYKYPSAYFLPFVGAAAPPLGRLAPYLDRLCLRFATPAVSSVPRTT